MCVNHSATIGGKIEISFRFFFNMKVYCVFSLESPHRGDSIEYIKYTIFSIKKKITLYYPKPTAMELFSRDKNELETAMVNEPSVFEPLTFYCMCLCLLVWFVYNCL